MELLARIDNSQPQASEIHRHPSLADRWLPQRGWIRATLRKAEQARAAILDAYTLQRPPPQFLN